MIGHKDVRINVESSNDGHSIEVLNADGDRALFSKYWNHNDVELGVGGELNFVELLEFLGYTVHHEEVY